MSTKVLKIALVFGILAAVLVTMTPSAVLAGGRGEGGPGGADPLCGTQGCVSLPPPYIGDGIILKVADQGGGLYAVTVTGTVTQAGSDCVLTFDETPFGPALTGDVPTCADLKPNDLIGLYSEVAAEMVGEGCPADFFNYNISVLGAGHLVCTDEGDPPLPQGTANLIMMQYKPKGL